MELVHCQRQKLSLRIVDTNWRSTTATTCCNSTWKQKSAPHDPPPWTINKRTRKKSNNEFETPTATNKTTPKPTHLFRLPASTTLIYVLISISILISSTSTNCSHLFIDDQIIGPYFEEHQEIAPKFFVDGTAPSSPTSPSSDFDSCANISNLRVLFTGFGDKFVIDLVKNERLISERYFEIQQDNDDSLKRKSDDRADTDFHKNHLFLNLNNLTTNHDHCHFQGQLNGNQNFISAISLVQGKLLDGFFHDETSLYHVTANKSSQTTTLTRRIPNLTPNISRRVKRDARTSNGRTRYSHSSSSSDNHIRHEPFASNSSSLYVELLVVHDHSQYMEYKGDKASMAERTMQIVNIMNAFYRQLNIFVALVGVVLWVEKDEIQLTEDGDSTLTNFLKYRYEKLLPKYHHDNAQLITSTSFNGSVVGKALKGPICTHEHSGGVNTDHSHSPAIVAVTLAHELGHNFGMEHDEEDKCKCPDEKCIMSSSSSLVHPKHWSSCSIEYLEDAKKHGLLDCLIDRPEKVFGPICGNGFVEDGEDCDLGEPIPAYGSSKSRKTTQSSNGLNQQQYAPPTQLANPCCDRQTCKFVGNATCAQGSCCDLTRCSVYNSTDTKVCRARKTECDFEEFCDGKSEFCPTDVHYHDGIECGPTPALSENSQPVVTGSASYNRSRAYCFSGHCTSHESQCQLLWGPSGSSSNDICYEQNIHGNTSGNCGYNRGGDKLYNSCETEDAICGMLHCVHNQPAQGDSQRKTGKLNYGFESASILTVSYFTTHTSRIYCHGAIIDAGPGVRDPGLVPNGAACGEDRMCLDQRCVPIYEVVYNGSSWCPSDCNGNGICDNMGVCHCSDGTIGSSCYQLFGANFHLSLLLYVVMFFIPMIGLIIFAINQYRDQFKIWWFLHNRKIALRKKSREPNQQRRLAYEADGHKVNISDPIPLNQQNNIHRPFYEPMLSQDPWAETPTVGSANDVGGKKSPGYRLEPLAKQPAIPVHLITAKSSKDPGTVMKPVRTAPPPPPAV